MLNSAMLFDVDPINPSSDEPTFTNTFFTLNIFQSSVFSLVPIVSSAWKSLHYNEYVVLFGKEYSKYE